MTVRTSHRRPSRLRTIAGMLIRGRDTRSILDDMDELFTRDIDRGLSRRRATLRYARNLVGSVYSVWRRRRPPPAIILAALFAGWAVPDVRTVLLSWLGDANPAWLALAAIAVIGVLGAASTALSVRLYTRRDL